MIELSSGQLEAWLGQYFWPLARIAGCIMVAPVFGARFVPRRFKVLLSLGITVLVAPLIEMPQFTPFSATGVMVTLQQVLIGVAMGFVMQVVFDSLAMGGQLLANSMGLSFAFNVDPQHGASTPVVGELYMLMVTLTFLALNGHLALLEALVQSFKTLPISQAGLSRDALWQIVAWGQQIFDGALMVALPGMTALLVVNLGFGVMSRAAPSLNMFAVGFPITLVFGMGIVMLGLSAVQTSFSELFRDGLLLLDQLLRQR